jgi:hypothetical protein
MSLLRTHTRLLLSMMMLLLSACNEAELPSEPSIATTPALNRLGPSSARLDLGILALMSKHWNCGALQSAIRGSNDVSIAFLFKTFGMETNCLKALASDPNIKRLEIYLNNETCMRAGRTCQPFEFMAKHQDLARFNRRLEQRDPVLLKELDKEFADAARVLLPILKTSNAACYVAPSLESNVSPRAGAALLNTAAKHFPSCFLVWNPVGGGPLGSSGLPVTRAHGYTGSALVIHERHNRGVTLGAPCIYSNDGDPTPADAFGARIEQYRHCRAQFFWTSSFNCIASSTGSAPFIRPVDRTACSTPAELNSITATLRAKR